MDATPAGPAAAVVVVDEVPAFRWGLASAFRQAGLAVEEPDDVAAWLAESGARAAVVTVRSDRDLDAITRLGNPRRAVVVVALVADHTAHACRLALAAGATSAVPQNASLAQVVATVGASVCGLAVLPAGAARSLAEGGGVHPDAAPLSSAQVGWLQALAKGTKVAELARRSGYSEREMYRSLYDLYQAMGVRGRSEALVRAVRWGLVDP